MKTVNRICLGVIALIILCIVFFRVFLIRIEVGEVGVRTKQYSVLGPKGVEEKDFGPGWHRRIPMLDTWNMFDVTVQTLEFASEDERQRTRAWFERYYDSGRKPIVSAERIQLRSDDGFNVQLDVTVKYHIVGGMAHKLYRDAGTETRYKQVVKSEAYDTLRTVFGGLRTEQFYNPTDRDRKTRDAEQVLSRKLEDRFVKVVGILIRDIAFDEAYEERILQKKLADQDAELNKSKTLAAEKRGETNKVEEATEAKVAVIAKEKDAELLTMKAETDKQVSEIRANAELEVAKLQADADLYAAEQIATGIQKEKEATAEGEQLKATAVTGPGGANYVAMEAVRNLELGDMKVSTLINDFLDIDGTIGKLGAQR